jgi:hypothetical protein
MFSGGNILYIGYFIALCSIVNSGGAVYFAVFVATLAYGFNLLIISMRCKNKRNNLIFALRGKSFFELITAVYLANCWWVIVLTWVYGVFVALFLNIPTEYVFRNFIGMVVYIVLPLLVHARISIDKVINLIVLAGAVHILILIYFLFKSFDVLLSSYDIVSLSDLRVTYALGALIILPIFLVSAASIFHRKWNERTQCPSIVLDYLCTKSGFVILILVIIIPSMSKGLFLTCIIFVFLTFIVATIERLRHGMIPLYLFVVMVGLVCFFIFIPQYFLDLFIFTFSDDELSNSIRSEQAKFLIDEFSFFGSGLGSSLKSGFVRDDVGGGFSFELSYLNIIHKLGIFSTPLLLSYVLTVSLALLRIFRGYQLLYSYFALGLMGYLILGSANPVLLSPISVMLHCFAIYILIYKSDTTRSE